MITPSLLRPFPCRLRNCLFLAACCVFIALPAHSQQAELDGLATKASKAVRNKHGKHHAIPKVAVLIDETDLGATPLSSMVLGDLQSALEAHAKGFTVISADAVRQTMEKEKISNKALTDTGTNRCLASDSGADVALIGAIQPSGNKLTLSLSAYPVTKGKSFFEDSVNFAPPPGLAGEKETPVQQSAKSASPASAAGIPEAGEAGYKPPACLYCPTPRFTDDGFSARVNGSVVLDTIIGADGRASSIDVVDGLPCGMTQSALETVKDTWRFKPAIGPDGRPTAIHTLVEVEFNVY